MRQGRMSRVINGLGQGETLDLGSDAPIVSDAAPVEPFAFDESTLSNDVAPSTNETVTVTSDADIQQLPGESAPPVIDNAIFSSIDVNRLVQAGGAIYRYVRQQDASGAVKYIPQRVNSVQRAGGSNLLKYALMGGALLLFLH